MHPPGFVRQLTIQQELSMANKADSSTDELKAYLLGKYQNQQVLHQPTASHQSTSIKQPTTPRRKNPHNRILLKP